MTAWSAQRVTGQPELQSKNLFKTEQNRTKQNLRKKVPQSREESGPALPPRPLCLKRFILLWYDSSCGPNTSCASEGPFARGLGPLDGSSTTT